ncbi:MAG: heavy-metal-associated domain-containing protein [Bacteroidota bacterium]
MRLSLILSTFLLFLSTSCFFSQTISFDLGIDGLTCSQCSKSVEMQLKKLDFVKTVEMDLANTRALIRINETSILSPDAIAKAACNAGFSVRYLKLLTSAEMKPCLIIAGFDGAINLQNNVTNIADKKVYTICFLGNSFQSKKELKARKEKLINNCLENTGKVYFAKVE